ncbi:hypothetical protein L6452_04698 [Arctium lappa]|uniref:Uncharacterized protein n=1 Tax=Arctium lappa TaxID=4217 RepID=A0ACB9EDY0_ARCLA|nr:hypothetical protein L6452_04698 [Arctium lappa]
MVFVEIVLDFFFVNSGWTTIVWLLSEAKATPNWQKVIGEELVKHLTTCGFSSNLRATFFTRITNPPTAYTTITLRLLPPYSSLLKINVIRGVPLSFNQLISLDLKAKLTVTQWDI